MSTETLEKELEEKLPEPLAKFNVSWDKLSEEDKSLVIYQSVADCLKSMYEKQDKTLLVWAPVGFKDDIVSRWNLCINSHVQDKAVLEKDHPNHSLFFPEFKEHESCMLPALFRESDQEYANLSKYFNSLLEVSGIDTDTLIPMKLTTDALRGAYLATEVLLPTRLNQVLEKLVPAITEDILSKVK